MTLDGAHGSSEREASAPPRLTGLCFAGSLAIAWLGVSSCAEERSTPPPLVYDIDVAPLVARRCVACHSGDAPVGGWRATSYLEVIACVGGTGTPATSPADLRAPLLSALDSEAHRGRIEPAERAVLEAWVAVGSPAFRGTVHRPGMVDPRSPDWHGTTLHAQRWRPMLDPGDVEACGRCHDGAPSRPASVSRAAPGATACTSCHTAPQGVLACGTCHGDGSRPYPPRDPCFFPKDQASAGAHAAHVERAIVGGAPLLCSTCHPVPGADVMGGLHGNGGVEVIFGADVAKVGPEASYDRTTGQCAVSCHDRGGERARPTFAETMKVGCGDCHGSPPANHFPGPCSQCHHEADATGTSLKGGPLHLNGRVDLGDGTGGCGACHGHGDDPWPSSGAHPAHQNPTLASRTDCSTCHAVPTTVVWPGHLDGVAQIALSGRALDRGSSAAWDGKSCAEVACHGAKLVDQPKIVPSWVDASGSARACGACHGVPPTQHTASTSCDRPACHGAEVTRSASDLSISASGRTLHVNGRIDLNRP